MCEFSRKLIAWIDGELAGPDALAVERHVECCAECQIETEKYKKIGLALRAYCDAAVGSKLRRPRRRWIPVVAGAIAAGVLVVALVPRRPAVERIVAPQFNFRPPAIAWERTPVIIRKAPARRVQRTEPAQAADWRPVQPEIRIAIPADAMFAPGALPEGFHFVTDVRVAADGSPAWIRFEP
jgi:hypothetical protein